MSKWKKKSRVRIKKLKHAIKSHSQDLTSSSVCSEIIYKKKTKTNESGEQSALLDSYCPTLKALQIHMYQCH